MAPATQPRRTASATGAEPAAVQGRVVGIDLGTSTTCVAVVDGGRARVIASRLGYNTIPSVLSFDDEGRPTVGHVAERQMLLRPESCIYGAKRLLGRAYGKDAILRYQPHFRYKLVRDHDGMIAAEVLDMVVSPQRVAAHILAEIHKVAELELGTRVTHAIITVPAYFTEAQRGAVREAGKMAGLQVLRVVSEPIAASLAYGIKDSRAHRVMVYDLGGGTFDVSVLEVSGGVYTVLATDGDTFLGGLDFDQRVVAMLERHLDQAAGQPVALSPVAQQRLYVAAREIKHNLSMQARTTCAIPHLVQVDGRDVGINMAITREEIEAATQDLVDRTIELCERVLAAAALSPQQIDDVLLVGGQTRMPSVERTFAEHFGRRPSKGIHPEEAVALGAAILADSHDRFDGATLIDVLPLPIGYAQPDGELVAVLPRNSPLPCERSVQLQPPPGRSDLEIAVFQGPNPRALDNDYLGTCVIPEVPTAGDRIVDVLFALDADCRLRISARVRGTGLEAEAVLSTQNTPDEVLQRMGKERVGRAATRTSMGAARPTAGRRSAAERRSQAAAADAATAAPPITSGGLGIGPGARIVIAGLAVAATVAVLLAILGPRPPSVVQPSKDAPAGVAPAGATPVPPLPAATPVPSPAMAPVIGSPAPLPMVAPAPPPVVAPAAETAAGAASEGRTVERTAAGAASEGRTVERTVADAASEGGRPQVPGRLRVTTAPAGAAVWVDGVLRGPSPQTIDAGPGRHAVVLIMEGARMVEREVDASEGVTIAETLAPVSPPALGGKAGIKVRCKTEGKYPVLVDGRETGLLCPTDRIELPAGVHQIGLFLPATRERTSESHQIKEGHGSTRIRFKN